MNAVNCFISWNVSPEIFSIGQLSLRYYGLCFVFAFLFASFIFYKILRIENHDIFLLPITANAVFLATLIGARLGECLFYFPEYYLKNPLKIFIPFENGEFIGIEGLSSHGAALAIPIALYIVAKSRNISFRWLLDRVCITVALGAVFIRIGNLMNSEILGTETTLPWGFIFQTIGENFARHPVQLYEAFSYFIIFFALYFTYVKCQKLPKGFITGLFFVLIFSSRFVLEIFKAPLNNFDKNSLLSTGQYLSLAFIFAGTIILMSSLMKSRYHLIQK